MTDASETATIKLQCHLVDTDHGIGLEIIIVGIATDDAARAIAEKIRRLLQDNTQHIFGDRRLLS